MAHIYTEAKFSGARGEKKVKVLLEPIPLGPKKHTIAQVKEQKVTKNLSKNWRIR